MDPILPQSNNISDGISVFSNSDEKPSRWQSFTLRINLGRVFIRWLRLTWLDILAMIFALVIAYIFKAFVPVFRQSERSFAMWRDGPDIWHGQTYISHPKERLILSDSVAGMTLAAIPIAVILLMQVFVRNFWDAHTAIFGLLKGLVTMYV